MVLNLNYCYSGSILFWIGEIFVFSFVKIDIK